MITEVRYDPSSFHLSEKEQHERSILRRLGKTRATIFFEVGTNTRITLPMKISDPYFSIQRKRIERHYKNWGVIVYTDGVNKDLYVTKWTRWKFFKVRVIKKWNRLKKKWLKR